MADYLMSSPDPLNDSPTFNSPPKRQRSPRVRHSLPLQGSSPKKQTFQLDVGNQLSPQKIRVTVEADGSDIENYINIGDAPSSPIRKPSNRRRERTTTTTIPVKGLSDSEEDSQEAATPKRGRGRPRKSAVTPVPGKKRTNTPTKKLNGRRRSIGSLVDGDDSADISFQIGQGVEIGRGKGTSRSRSTKGTSRKSTPAAKLSDGADKAASSTRSKGRGRRKTLLPEDLAVLEDSTSGLAEAAIGRVDGAVEPLDTHRGCPTSANSIVPPTITSDGDVPDVSLARFRPGNETPRRTGWSSPRAVEASITSSSKTKNDSFPLPSVSPVKSLPGEEERTVSYEQPDSHPVGQDPEDNHDEHDEMGEMPEFDTILESEGFSMISVDSVPSLREHHSSPPVQGENEEIPAQKSSPFISLDRTSGQHARNDNSFSVIASQNSAKTTPAKTLAAKLLARQSSKASLDGSLAAPSVHNQGSQSNDIQSDYEDDFSEIPSAILQAATPAALRQMQDLTDRLKASNPPLRRVSAQSTGSTHSRLLTPEDTPSPPLESTTFKKSELAQHLLQPLVQETQEDNSHNYSQIKSSPPSVAPRRSTYSAHLQANRSLNAEPAETPSIVFSSPTLPPRLPRIQPALTIPASDNARPALSPILRAGQVLQNITVPSSPRSRSQSLGSPFKSPVAGRRSSPMNSHDSRLSPANELRTRPVPRAEVTTQLSSGSSQSRREEDPFRTNAQERSLEPKQLYRLDIPQSRRYSDPRLDQLRAGGDTPRSDDAMSWQAEEEVFIPGGNVPTKANTGAGRSSPNLTSEERWEAERAEVRKQAAAVDEVIVIDSDEERSQQEVDDLLLETLNSSSPIVSREEPSKETTERPRRGKIPSPWRKNSKRLVYSDEPSQFTSPPAISKPYQFPSTQEVRPEPITVRRVFPPELSDSLDDADLSAWQIPQKSNFKPRVRESTELDLSALLSASPLKKLPTLSGSSTGGISAPQSSSEKASKLSISSSRIQNTGKVQKDTSQPAGFTPIAQKANFDPRPRAGSSSPVKAAFPSMLIAPANSQSSNPYQPPFASSPNKTNDVSARQLFSPPVSEDDSPSETNSKENLTRTQEWAASLKSSSGPTTQNNLLTPSRPLSPSKSCLKTPSWEALRQESPSKGVTFVSSSPLPDEDSMIQLSGTTWSKAHWKLLDSILQSWKPSTTSTNTNTSPDSMSSSSNSSATNSNSEPLDRRGSYQFSLHSNSNGSNSDNMKQPQQPRLQRRNSTRVISKLLGKKVSSRGESMKLEQWHLEVVDEFRGVVPGWEESVVAMRVFALLVGERKRVERGEGDEMR